MSRLSETKTPSTSRNSRLFQTELTKPAD